MATQAELAERLLDGHGAVDAAVEKACGRDQAAAFGRGPGRRPKPGTQARIRAEIAAQLPDPAALIGIVNSPREANDDYERRGLVLVDFGTGRKGFGVSRRAAVRWQYLVWDEKGGMITDVAAWEAAFRRRVEASRRRVDEWQRRLVDLSRRNRLLYHRPTKRQALELSAPSAQKIADRLLGHEEWSFWFPPASSELAGAVDAEHLLLDASALRRHRRRETELLTDAENATELQRTLDAMYRRSAVDFQERGVQILHVAFGLLRWRDPESGDDVSSPLILLPVELHRDRIGQPFVLQRSDDDPVVNPTLAVKLDRALGVQLPDIEGTLEAGDADDYELADYFAAVERLQPGWRVDAAAILGQFTFYKEVIFRDLKANWPTAIETPLVGSLASGEPLPRSGPAVPGEDELDDVQDPADALAVLDADASQRVCLEAVRRGASVVIQGPPGTGKSQTIANLIGQAIGEGKSVLFVSEKMAALDVVFKRLTEAGLDEFCLELHSHKTNKRHVATTLAQALEDRVEQRAGLAPAEIEQLRRSRKRLNDYVDGLHERREPLGISVFDAFAVVAEETSAPVAPPPTIRPEETDAGSLAELRREFERLAERWSQVTAPDEHPWRGYSRAEAGLRAREEVRVLLRHAGRALEDAQATTAAYASEVSLPAPRDHAEARALVTRAALLAEPNSVPEEWLGSADPTPLAGTIETWTARSNEHRSLAVRLQHAYSHYPSQETCQAFLEGVSRLAIRSGRREACELIESRSILDDLHAVSAAVASAREAGSQIASALGVVNDDVGWGELELLVATVEALAASQRPLPEWLRPAFFQEATQCADRLRRLVERERELSMELGERWNDSVVELSEMRERFEADRARRLPWLRGQHRADRAALKSASRTGRIPGSVIDDLVAARKLGRVRHELRQLQPEASRLLGPFANGADTDLEALKGAFGMRALIFTSVLPRCDLVQLERAMRDGVDAQTEFAGSRVAEAATRWREASKPAALLAEASAGWPLSKVGEWLEETRVVLTEIFGAREAIVEQRLAPANDLAEIEEEAGAVLRLREIERDFAEEGERLRILFPRWDVGPSGDWQAIAQALAWAQAIRATFTGTPPTEFAKRVGQPGFRAPTHGSMDAAVRAAEAACGSVGELFIAGRRERVEGALVRGWDEALAVVTLLADHIDGIVDWIDFASARAELERRGWGRFVERLVEMAPDASQVRPAFERGFHAAWAEGVLRADPRLRDFRGADHEQQIAEFRRLDRRLIEHAREMVIYRANGRRPRQVDLAGSEIERLRKEASKRRGTLPVRALFRAIPGLVTALKPCLLMSPLSVSQFLDSAMRFDLVIFDEASQVTVEDAICALYRGRQQVIAGDSRQLPPTAFFHVGDESDESDETDVSEAQWESILERAEGTGLNSVPLRWHYRSRHESLIAYSNHYFYEGRLTTFPSPWRQHPHLGVRLHHIAEALYDRGRTRTNPREAEVVARLTLEHFRDQPQKSLGVVTFNQPQATAVQDALDRLRYENRDYERFFADDRLEGFFVKNLENVQGDERDCMIFSITYGRDSSGGLSLNFGPLNQRGGARRLNVAVTRAREQVIVVSSLRAADFTANAELSEGPSRLRDYLAYAEQGATEEAEGGGRRLQPSRFEVAVAGAIRDLGHEVVPLVGQGKLRVDLGVVDPKEPGRFILGVQTDGPRYRGTPTERDRDRLRDEVLSQLGWSIARVWSPDWTTSHTAALARLDRALRDARLSDRSDSASAASGPPIVLPPPEGASNSQRPRARVVSPPTQPPGPSRAGFGDIEKASFSERADAVAEVVASGFGMRREDVQRYVARDFGYGRTSPRIRAAVDEAIEQLLATGRIAADGEVLRLARGGGRSSATDVPEQPAWETVLAEQAKAERRTVDRPTEAEITAKRSGGPLRVSSRDPAVTLEATLHVVVDPATPRGAGADRDQRYVAVEVTLRNTGTVRFDPSTVGTRWTLVDDAGEDHDEASTRVLPTIHASRLQPRGSVRGFITFQLPKGVAPAKLLLQIAPGAQLATWNVAGSSRQAGNAQETTARTKASTLRPRAALRHRVDLKHVREDLGIAVLAVDDAAVVNVLRALTAADVSAVQQGGSYVSARGRRQNIVIPADKVDAANGALRSAGLDLQSPPWRH